MGFFDKLLQKKKTSGKERLQLAFFSLENAIFFNISDVNGIFSRCHGVFLCSFKHIIFITSLLSRNGRERHSAADSERAPSA